MVSLVRIDRPTGVIEVDNQGIIHASYQDGTTMTERLAREEVVIFDEIAKRQGRMLLLNDLRGRITADRGARRVYGEFFKAHSDAKMAFVFDSKLVEVALNFIARLYDRGRQRDMRAFPTFEDAYTWLEGYTKPEFTRPPVPFEMPPHFTVT